MTQSTPETAHSSSADPKVHAVYDGIEEHDNRLPNWWLATLFIAIIFSVFYWYYYQVTGAGPSQYEALKQEQTQLAALAKKNPGPSANALNQALAALARDPQVVARGEVIFKANCVVCHGQKGEGSIGPNLTDKHWLHGGHPAEIYETITQGVIEKGMLAWGPTLGDDKVKDVTAFVLSLKNSNVAGGKAAQGEEEK